MAKRTGTDSPTIVFSHANGFPSGTYRLLFEHWRAAGFSVHAVEKFGHDPRFPVSSNWPHLSDELRAFIESLQTGPVYLVGHSMGGFTGLMLARQHPGDVGRLMIVDSLPFFSGMFGPQATAQNVEPQARAMRDAIGAGSLLALVVAAYRPHPADASAGEPR